MTPQEIEIARRAVARKGWRWMPGMLVNSGGTIYRMTEETIALGCGSPEYQREYMRPDLADPATLGCLLALVREAWRDPDAHVVRARWGTESVTGWTIRRTTSAASLMAPPRFELTEAEALVAALEAAS